MRLAMQLVFACFTSIASASQALNHIACVYFNDGTKWTLWSGSYATSSFQLAPGERRMLSGGWTSEKPTPPNYAYCTAMVGTSSNDSVIMETYQYQAEKFFGSGPNADCTINGWGVELLSKGRISLARGSFAELETEWIPPDASRVRVREYFPLQSELSNVNKLSATKCAELLPK